MEPRGYEWFQKRARVTLPSPGGQVCVPTELARFHEEELFISTHVLPKPLPEFSFHPPAHRFMTSALRNEFFIFEPQERPFWYAKYRSYYTMTQKGVTATNICL